MTTCHGHVNYIPPVLPVKGGWFHLLYPPEKHSGLFSSLENYCSGKKDLNCNSHPFWDGSNDFFTLANFDFKGQNPENPNYNFKSLNPEEKEEFWEKMNLDWQRHLGYWDDITQIFKDYITKEVSKDIESLPFM